MSQVTLDLSDAPTARKMAFLEHSRLWASMAQGAGVVRGATDSQVKNLLAALVAHVAYDVATQKIKTDDDAALAGELGLIGVVAGLVGREEALPRAETKHVAAPVGFTPNQDRQVYVLARGPDGLIRLRLCGWRVMADGTVEPVPAGKPPGRWCVADEPNATAVWPDGRVVNLGLAEDELLEGGR